MRLPWMDAGCAGKGGPSVVDEVVAVGLAVVDVAALDEDAVRVAVAHCKANLSSLPLISPSLPLPGGAERTPFVVDLLAHRRESAMSEGFPVAGIGTRVRRLSKWWHRE